MKGIYREGKAMIKVNDDNTNAGRIERGVEPGCPLSPMLFALAIEPLADRMRNRIRIRGYEIGKEKIALNLYADDILLMLGNPLEAIRELLIISEDFKSYSGLGVNIQKSEMMFRRVEIKEQNEIAKSTGMEFGIRDT